MADTASTIHYATGRRKAAVARVWVSEGGTGQIIINGRPIDDYFPRYTDRAAVAAPLILTENEGKLDVRANVKGGGHTGQAFAVRHGVSRALTAVDAELRGIIKKEGMLRRDARVKERKKYGQPGARKRYQFSKR